MTMEQAMQKHTILRLDVSHVKRVEAVSIEPSSTGAVIIAGKNAAGKSSVLDSILYALAGTRALPDEPLQHGAAKGSITLDLGDLIVERGFTASGGTSLTVRTKDKAAKLAKPQSVLDELLGAVGVDPVAFISAKPEEQARVIAEAAGKADELARLRDELMRRMRERQSMAAPLKSLDGRVAALQHSLDALPSAEEGTDFRAREAALREFQDADRRARQVERRITDLYEELERAQREYDEAEADVARVVEKLGGDAPDDVAAELEAIGLRADEVASVSGQRRAVTQQLAGTSAERDELSAAYETATSDIERLRGDIDQVSNGVTVPGVEGLSVGEDGVRVNGVRFESLSQAEKIRAAVAISVAGSPRFPVVLVREGSLLDDDNLRLLAETAAELGAQVWVERVGTHDAGAIVIEDGRVIEAKP